MKPIYWRLLPLIIFTVLVAFFWHGLSLDPQKIPSAWINKPIPSFKLPDLQVNGQFFTSQQLRGKISLLNIWASWCNSCAQEQIFLMQLADEGIDIFGLNYKDQRDDAIKWLKKWGNPYQQIASDSSGSVAIDLGVYGTPETFLIDSQGIVRYRHAGVLDIDIWQREFLPLLKNLENR
ncbi:MAG: DsbE family thiol:disulfide interchange protein [Legionella sp.]